MKDPITQTRVCTVLVLVLVLVLSAVKDVSFYVKLHNNIGTSSAKGLMVLLSEWIVIDSKEDWSVATNTKGAPYWCWKIDSKISTVSPLPRSNCCGNALVIGIRSNWRFYIRYILVLNTRVNKAMAIWIMRETTIRSRDSWVCEDAGLGQWRTT